MLTDNKLNYQDCKGLNYIKSINEYKLLSIFFAENMRDINCLEFKINQNGLYVEKFFDLRYVERVIKDENAWIYLGGVPTSEIRK